MKTTHARLAAAASLAALSLVACRRPAATPLAWVAVGGDNHVRVLDLTTGETLRKIYSGAGPWRMVLSPDDKHLWVQHWYAGTTAVIDVASGEIGGIVPLRGPGAFSADGGTFLSFDWPASTLSRVDPRSLEVGARQATEIQQVYDVAAAADGESLLLVQHDPMARGPAPRYGYVALYRPGAKEGASQPVSLKTGPDPLAAVPVPGQPFVLTVDSGTTGLSILNNLGDGRSLAACPAPRAVALAPDGHRMAVVCWRGHGAPHSRAVVFRTDFSARPWPRFETEAERELPGGLVAATFTPDGAQLLLVDRPGGRLLVTDPSSLASEREIATGDEPLAVVATEATPGVRQRLAQGESRGRRLLETTLAQLREAGTPFRDLSWTETAVWYESPEKAEGSGGEALERRRTLHVSLRPPDAVRIETEDAGLRLARGGRSLTVDESGRYWVSPRQDLVPIVLALPALPVAEAVRELAGDVPGSPFLRGGLAVDLGFEVEEGGERFRILGADRPGRRMAQVWVAADTGLPTNVVEQFPVYAVSPHEQGATPGIAETKLYDYARLDGRFLLPQRLERKIEGRWQQQVRIDGVTGNTDLPADAFDLDRLGGSKPPPGELFATVPIPAAAEDGTVRRVPISPGPEVTSPFAPHPPYASAPPTSGAHLPYPPDAGVSSTPVPLALQVHFLLDGGVALQYNCPQPCPEMVARLAAVAAREDGVLVAPFPWMDARLTLTAWGRIESLRDFDGPAVARFLAAYGGRDHHPEIERGEDETPRPKRSH